MRDCSEGYFGTFDSEQQDGSQDNTTQRGALRTSDSVQVKRVRDCSEGYFGTFDSEQQDGTQDNRQRGACALLSLLKALEVRKSEGYKSTLDSEQGNGKQDGRPLPAPVKTLSSQRSMKWHYQVGM